MPNVATHRLTTTRSGCVTLLSQRGTQLSACVFYKAVTRQSKYVLAWSTYDANWHRRVLQHEGTAHR